MRFRVNLIADVEEDLLDIYRYVAVADSPQKAEKLLTRLEETCLKLELFPNKGHVPPELKRIDVYDYREVLCHSYKIIYHIFDRDFYIHCVLDGRRDLQDLLQRRLVRQGD